jgi:predicted enzyme related to lactoylglutathione lyase
MHRSRLGGFIIDCKTKDLEGATAFWSAALGMESRTLPGPEGKIYTKLLDADRGLDVEVQVVDHDSRVHLDIESDDIEAEVRRLESLGARRVAKIKGWIVMEAPTGQRFCVVKVHGRDFAEKANVWK